jgi:hypothetical protein
MILEQTVPEMVSSNAFIITKKYNKPVHFLAYALDQIMENQWSGNISTIEEARQFVRNNAKNWKNIWMQSKQDSSFNLSKKAEAKEETVYMEYTAKAPFCVGDKVRLRVPGLAFGQIQGRVTKIDNNIMEVQMQTGKYRGKVISVDLLDSVKLSLTWEKIQ